jgi:hypothetical protein
MKTNLRSTGLYMLSSPSLRALSVPHTGSVSAFVYLFINDKTNFYSLLLHLQVRPCPLDGPPSVQVCILLIYCICYVQRH